MKRIFLLCIVLLISSGCLYFDYAVDRESMDLPYETYYPTERGKRYDFHTVLYSESENEEEPIDYSSFAIYLTHLNRNFKGENKGDYTSRLSFQNVKDTDVKVDYSTIRLIHKDANGNIIPEISSSSTYENKEYVNHMYAKVYDKNKLTNLITEYVYVEIESKGKRKVVEFTFPIKKKYHYSFWDVMMGV